MNSEQKTIWIATLFIIYVFHFADVAAISLIGKRISSANGLLCNAVNEIVQDNNGYIWMGTSNGLSRYDGYSTVNFKYLSSNENKKTESHIGRLFFDRKNNLLWTRTATFINSCYDLNKSRFVDYTGCGDNMRVMAENFISSNGMWMYNTDFGVRYISYHNGSFHKTDYTKENRLLPSNNVRAITEDTNRQIWIMTDKGIVTVTQDGRSRIVNNKDNILSGTTYHGSSFFFTAGNKVLVYDSKGELTRQHALPTALGSISNLHNCLIWNGLLLLFTDAETYAMDIKTGTFTKPQQIQIPNGVFEGEVNGYKFMSNSTGTLWIFPDRGEIKVLKLISNALFTNNKIHKYKVVKDRYGQLCIATYGNGLFIYNPHNGALSHYTAEDENPLIYSNYLMYVMIDRTGCIWTGSDTAGASCISSFKGATAEYILPEPDHKGDWANNIIRIFKKNTNSLLVCNREHSIFEYDIKDQSIHYVAKHNSYTRAFFLDKEGHLWMGTYGDGLYVDNQHYTSTDKASYIPADIVQSICSDRYGRIWLTTWGGGLLMTKYENGKKLQFKQFLSDNINESKMRDLEYGRGSDLWIASNNGLYMFDTSKKNITRASFRCYNTSNGKFPVDEIIGMHYSKKGDMWVCAPGRGAMRCKISNDFETISHQDFTTREGLANDNVNVITEDRNGNIWLGTEEGATEIKHDTQVIRSYQFSPIFHSNVYQEKCAILGDDGKLYMGTCYGMAVITPGRNDITDKNIQANITDLKVNGTSVFENDKAYEDVIERMNNNKRISLAHNQNTLSIYFSNFDYASISSAQYRYYLEGADSTWCPLTSINHADYSNLDPGLYTFHLRSLNNSEETTLVIKIHEPWYNTWWAWIVYLSLCIAVGIYIYNNWHEKFVLHQQMIMEKQLNEFRQNFFTHVTHEFRTPLAIIQVAADSLMKPKTEVVSKSSLQTIQRGTKRMLRLINLFMEFRKANTGNLKIHIEKADIIDFIRRIYQDFWSISKQKDIQLTFTPFTKKHEILFDKQMIETIINNLISNAIKYTPTKGWVQVKVNLSNDLKTLIITCEDNGPGISAKQQEELFKPFMHGYVSQGGMGIGLYTSYEMATAHHGMLAYKKATEEGGSLFTLTLPADDSVYNADDYRNERIASIANEKKNETNDTYIREMVPKAFNDLTIAIIEDDPDMMEQIRCELSIYFHVDCYANGKSGCEGVINTKPALLICDVMLPDMNGYEVVKAIKSNEETFRMPVIMLTALDDETHQIKGYKVGADDYMVKPCNFNILVARSSQLIKWSQSIGNDRNMNDQRPTESIVTNQADVKFKEEVTLLISQHINDPDFNIDQLASMLNIGRTKFFGKMKELTGMSPNKYLLNERMSMAADLLVEGKMNVSEVCYKIGFTDTSYFNKCFKMKYGVVASKYRKK